jgi:hypothetical protein
MKVGRWMQADEFATSGGSSSGKPEKSQKRFDEDRGHLNSRIQVTRRKNRTSNKKARVLVSPYHAQA